LLGLFNSVCIALCTSVAHNTAQNRPNNFPSYPLYDHPCSNDLYLRDCHRLETAEDIIYCSVSHVYCDTMHCIWCKYKNIKTDLHIPDKELEMCVRWVLQSVQVTGISTPEFDSASSHVCWPVTKSHTVHCIIIIIIIIHSFLYCHKVETSEAVEYTGTSSASRWADHIKPKYCECVMGILYGYR